MSIRTIRFNESEEKAISKLAKFYETDFSGMIKQMVLEKLEDLDDLRSIRKIKETSAEHYLSAKAIDGLFK